MWRGSDRLGLSVVASFVWRRPNNLAVTLFHIPLFESSVRISRTGLSDMPSRLHTRQARPYVRSDVRDRSTRRDAGMVSPAPATSELVLVA